MLATAEDDEYYLENVASAQFVWTSISVTLSKVRLNNGCLDEVRLR